MDELVGAETLSLDQTAPAPTEPAVRSQVNEHVGRYKLRHVLGEGGMSRVFLARDTMLGRSVALKLIRPERMTKAEVGSFIREARITAQLNHPHVIQLYDAGEHDDGAFLALEYLEGESLKQRLARERLSTDEALRIARAIADAVAHAHALRIHHRDLKPSNVMLPADGRVRVVDFGLASMIGAAELAGGTPDWMAPEQWRGDPTDDRVDIWALGVLAYQLFGREHPFGPAIDAATRRSRVLDIDIAPRPLDGEVPDAVRVLVARSLQRDPQARPTAREWAATLEAQIGAHRHASDPESPFRGLASFEERHAHLFFGREQEIDAFVERLRDEPFLPIVGSSGSGKSSFLHAGVIPRLRAVQRWCVITLRPGGDPFAALAHALCQASQPAVALTSTTEISELARDLAATPSLLAARLETISRVRGARILLACDQLEELFANSDSRTAHSSFIAALCGAADDAAEPVRVTFTLRDDFLGHIPEIKQLFVLRRLGPADLRQTIVAPIARAGYDFDDPSIVDDMLADVHGSPFELPLLQFACRTLWDGRDTARRLLLKQSYLEQGGVARALANHADGVIAAMPAPWQRMARTLFGRLVTGTKTRRTVEVEALVEGLGDDARGIVDRLVSARLLVKARVPGDDAHLVEIAHESLLETWAQLATWLESSHEERRTVQELEDLAAAWVRRGELAEHAPNAAELATARDRIERLGITPSATVGRFLAAGLRRQQARRRRRVAVQATVASLAAFVTIGSISLARSFRDKKDAAEAQAAALRLAHGNTGQLVLTVELFDGSPEQPLRVSPSNYPDLSVRLFAADPHDARRPGDPLAPNLVHVIRVSPGVFRIEAPGGPVFLQVDGRGHRDEPCAASWLRLQAFPGFADRAPDGGTSRAVVSVPSCTASRSNSVAIPAGPMIYGGAGDPPTRYPDYVETERVVDVPAFAIDRTEVSNAAFRAFAMLAPMTGYAVPSYPSDGSLGGRPDEPVTAIDAYEAEAYCRYLGKRLPSDVEWTKAARGGLHLSEGDNPSPRRLYPWGTTWRPECVNLDGSADGYAWIAPVDAMPCGRSPYGVLGLVGNVAEWISREGQIEQSTPLREVRGGAANSPVELQQVTTVFRNSREARHFDFATGVRCATDGDPVRGSRWVVPARAD